MNFSQASKLPEGTLVKVVRANNPGHDWWYKVGHIYTVGCCSSGDGAFGVMGEDGDVSPCDFGGWEFEELDAAPRPPALDGKPHVVGYMPDHPDGDPLILLEDHLAHLAPLQAEIASERELRRELGVRVHQLKDELKDVKAAFENAYSEGDHLLRRAKEAECGRVQLKPLYIIAGSSDGYNYIQYTFDKELAERMTNQEEDYMGMDSGPDVIMVPEAMTYADLGICRPLEEDFEE